MRFNQSPWGTVQSEYVFPYGIYFVSTASHGGFLVPKEFADSTFSEKHLQVANTYCDPHRIPKGYYAFEEDCACLAVMCEVPKVRGNMTQKEAEDAFDRIYCFRKEDPRCPK